MKIAASTFSLLRSLTGTFSDVDHTEYIVSHWPDTLSALLDRAMDARDRIGEDAFFDVAYADVVRDPVAVVGTIYERFGIEWNADKEAVLPALPRRQPAAQVRHAHLLARRGGGGARCRSTSASPATRSATTCPGRTPDPSTHDPGSVARMVPTAMLARSRRVSTRAIRSPA